MTKEIECNVVSLLQKYAGWIGGYLSKKKEKKKNVKRNTGNWSRSHYRPYVISALLLVWEGGAETATRQREQERDIFF